VDSKTLGAAILAAQRIARARVYLIGGPSGAGKTTLGRAIAKIRGAIIIHLDDYFRDERVVIRQHSTFFGSAPQWDRPASVDFRLACKNLTELIAKNETELPMFSFFTNRRTGYRKIHCATSRAFIIEGVQALRLRECARKVSPEVCCIFVDADADVRKSRIRKRDANERGRKVVDFERRFYFILKAEERWIRRQKAFADIVFDTTARGVFRKTRFG
jgi:uridine kinase